MGCKKESGGKLSRVIKQGVLTRVVKHGRQQSRQARPGDGHVRTEILSGSERFSRVCGGRSRGRRLRQLPARSSVNALSLFFLPAILFPPSLSRPPLPAFLFPSFSSSHRGDQEGPVCRVHCRPEGSGRRPAQGPDPRAQGIPGHTLHTARRRQATPDEVLSSSSSSGARAVVVVSSSSSSSEGAGC